MLSTVIALYLLTPQLPALAEGSVGHFDIELTDEQVLLGTGFKVDHLLADAEAGIPAAQYLVAWAWIVGKKGPEWEAKAKTYLLKAANAREPRAMAFVAILKSKGRVFDVDETEAFKFALGAAEMGNEHAQHQIAQAYDKGAGVERDPVEALKWYLISACQGVDVGEPVRGLRAALGKQQQEESHRRVFAWKASHPGVKPHHIGRSLEQQVRESMRETHPFQLTPGDPGQVFSTKIGGVPWWPKGTPRPICSSGHQLKFVAQTLLSDVPGLKSTDRTLLSFHYCNVCQRSEDVYDVRLFNESGSPPDGKGVVTEAFGETGTPAFKTTSDYADGFESFSSSDRGAVDITNYPGFESDGWEERYPNVEGYKLGGWPSWLQGAFSPECPDKHKMVFVGQIDSSFSSAVIWGGGGYAYLFVCPESCKQRHAEMFIQFT